ncbi:AraC family transcriptional regulator [Vibrio lentus]|uniref:hypothetical protein n=1 Tax=Vibrio lentus TaxID=136468 RepID=UPI000C8408CE|nr:hypothetical protein [Vibrio lentus]MCB5460141.1 AraC family transcriptional regulator [Vibrio lentus]MCC4849317.1 AraC family transcriptional regulator [Vibrio lentus]MCC5493238.1 AraC family transcriptional regulator [Vibrio lentus]MCC5530519.1 AraC family transcriptional regulator [Vibrio lentus]MCC5537039.1 AraC family transcriptional regulator [Vibrio lentus]
MKNLQEKDIVRAIDVLKASDSFNVSKLAAHLGVSRSNLYKYYRHLLPDRSSVTENKIKNAVLTLQARTGSVSLTITEVAIAAGVTRQSISRDYKHLIPIIQGESMVDIAPNSAIRLEKKVRELEAELLSMKENSEKNHADFQAKVYSSLMKQDVTAFNAYKDKASVIKLQNQIDEITRINRDQLSEMAELRSQLLEYKNKSQQRTSGCNVLTYVKADYNSIPSDLDTGKIMKLLFELEEENIKNAIEVCFSSQPDAIIFFQPFLSCNFASLGLTLAEGNIVIIESNFPQAKHFETLLRNVSEVPVHAISAKGHEPQLTQFYCRQNYQNKFNNEFIERLYNLIAYPEQADGFQSITTVKPKPLLLAVK